MTGQLTDEEIRTLRRMSELFDKNEEDIMAGVEAIKGLRGVGLVGGWLKSFLIWLGILLGSWFALNNWIIAAIKRAMS